MQATVAIGVVLVGADWAVGATKVRVLETYVCPHLVQMTTTSGGTIPDEASLGLLGLGNQPPVPSWGRMLLEVTHALTVVPRMAVSPRSPSGRRSEG